MCVGCVCQDGDVMNDLHTTEMRRWDLQLVGGGGGERRRGNRMDERWVKVGLKYKRGCQ